MTKTVLITSNHYNSWPSLCQSLSAATTRYQSRAWLTIDIWWKGAVKSRANKWRLINGSPWSVMLNTDGQSCKIIITTYRVYNVKLLLIHCESNLKPGSSTVDRGYWQSLNHLISIVYYIQLTCFAYISFRASTSQLGAYQPLLAIIYHGWPWLTTFNPHQSQLTTPCKQWFINRLQNHLFRITIINHCQLIAVKLINGGSNPSQPSLRTGLVTITKQLIEAVSTQSLSIINHYISHQ